MHKRAIEIVPDPGVVQIRGARQNNLKGIDLDLPLGKLNVICGPSGSGKSSLAFDTIYAEGQRRYVETFSPYTRQFLDRMDKPQVDEIRGIPPAIAIEQANNIKSSRSTVGTMTEINDYLKNWLPRIARAFCPSCDREVRPETAQSIAREVLRELGSPPICHPERSFAEQNAVEGSREGEALTPSGDPSTPLRSARDDKAAATLVTFGVPVPPKTVPKAFFEFLKEQGYVRVWIDGEIHRTDAEPAMKRIPGLVHVIQDRIVLAPENQSRLVEAIETAVRFGKGRVAFIDWASAAVHPFSTGWHCAHCDIDITPPTPGLFSFNNPVGACPRCRGFGRTITIDLDRAIPDRNLSIANGAVRPFQTENGRECQRDLLRHAAMNEVDVHCPFSELPESD
ncbi:MAG: hypothetical protein M3O82_03050, partial [Verrucomicrobiota bacterium]|nr:hypothetical protein [Verrucomicrobiota bacterium]